MNAALTMNLIEKIVHRVTEFSPRRSRTSNLSDVISEPKNTEIMFITTPEGPFRLEAEIESVQFGGGGVGKYQIGHTRLFENNGRNKRVEMTVVDIERYEVHLPSQFQRFTNDLFLVNSIGLWKSFKTARRRTSRRCLDRT